MPHKADDSFFDEKRSWSKRKDEICYLTAYLPKIMTVGKPVLIVDGFAGPGKFQDGSDGSPLIICDCVYQTNRKKLRSPQPVKLWCIEKTDSLFELLASSLDKVAFAEAFHGSFADFSDTIADTSNSHSVFLYVDPFTVEGLVWEELARIYSGLNFGNSIEILLNLNSQSFVRRALAVMKAELDGLEDEDDSGEKVDAEFDAPPSIARLNTVAGGDWWQRLIRKRLPFSQAIDDFTSKYCDHMKQWFDEVVYHPIKATPTGLPKYYLVFGTRHIDGLELMNNEMVKSRRHLAELAKLAQATIDVYTYHVSKFADSVSEPMHANRFRSKLRRCLKFVDTSASCAFDS